jgi:selenide,water dikinase
MGDASDFVLGDGSCRLVGTVDFGTPVVDDPVDWARISVANALSDLYAVGSTPVFALAVLGWPESLDVQLAADAMRASRAILAEVGVMLGGGHTITSAVPFLGFAVVGSAANRPMAHSAFSVGDQLYLTKPLGTGFILASSRFEIEVPAELFESALRTMSQDNRLAGQVALEAGVEASTDVTGYGLLGSCWDASQASNVRFEIEVDRIPVLDGVHDLLNVGAVPTRAEETWMWLLEGDALVGSRDIAQEVLLSGPETSGGLLLGVAAPDVDRFEDLARQNELPIALIGSVRHGSPGVALC